VKDYIAERVCDIADHMLENKCTVRSAATRFGVSKSTVHKDISERLKLLDRTKYEEVKKLLETNKSQRHIRGGNATKNKYLKNRQI